NTGIGSMLSDDVEEKADEKDKGLIDRAVGLEYCAGSEEIYTETLKAYVEENMGDKLDTYYSADDWDNYRITAHSIKSTSKAIGAMGLSDFAKEMEAFAKEKKIGEIASRHEAFVAKYCSVIDEIKAMLRDMILDGDDRE
nr:Hpt domain-containing protein [Lachnospiraceae bacterium]